MTKTNIYVAISFFILGLIVMYGGCKRTIVNNPVAQTSTKTVKVHDTTTVTIKVPDIKQTVVYVDKPVYLKKIDSIEAIAEYGKEFIYNRSYSDTSVKISLTDTVSENSIKGTKWDYQILKPTQIVTTVNTTQVSAAKNSVWAGITIGGNKGYFAPIATVGFNIKDSKLITAGYDPLNKVAYLTGLIRIHL